ncbi:MAG TPA: tyrosine-type recombinase/integrase, partial [Herpetosiphonaceae bacterium]
MSLRATEHAPIDELNSWTWPVDLAEYDQMPTLYADELEALAELVRLYEKGCQRWPPIVHTALARILRPLNDVLNSGHPQPAARSAVNGTLLREMYHRKQSFWAWNHDDWAEIIRNKNEDGRIKQHMMAVAYLLCDFSDLRVAGMYQQYRFACRVFGKEMVDLAIQRVMGEYLRLGYAETTAKMLVHAIVSELLLANRSPILEALTVELLERVRSGDRAIDIKQSIVGVSRALASLGVITRPLAPVIAGGVHRQSTNLAHCAPDWLHWSQRWRDTSTLPERTRKNQYNHLLKVGRWLAEVHPEAVHPAEWTREVAAECVAAVVRMTVGQWVEHRTGYAATAAVGKPLAPRSKNSILQAVRLFFRDCQEWNWIPRRFDPQRSLATPRAVRSLIAPDPRILADDIWAKLLGAGLNLTAEDLPARYPDPHDSTKRVLTYPLEMVRALVIVWLFAGLRADEIRRLRVGCIRWQHDDVVIPGTAEVIPKDAVCLLSIPPNKTNTAYTKPVDYVVGQAIALWEHLRPEQPPVCDPKTAEFVHFLFSIRSMLTGRTYLNDTVIPMLCRKAGVPQSDARGLITSHRARATIASQLFNSKEPMTLFELQEWLGHRSPETTQHYAKITPTRLAKAYADANYFGRNVRTIEVLIDQDAVKSGAVTQGEPWMYYDLGHGYCTYDFFDQCQHRMACARCDFYRPKNAMLRLLEESKRHLLHLRQQISLTDTELAAIENDMAATEKLISGLTNIPTPAGPTPQQLAT